MKARLMYYIIEGELSGATEKTFGAKAPDAQARRRHCVRDNVQRGGHYGGKNTRQADQSRSAIISEGIV